jgi:tripartite-type tricarboxylate transporter receptor subunit TctC
MRQPALIRTIALSLFAAAAFNAHAQSASADDYPNRAVKHIVPFTPAGVADNAAPKLPDRLTVQLKQPFVVENRPGAGGNIGNDVVAKAPPDGYTLLLGFDSTLVINPLIFPNIGFDPIKDFAPITKLGDSTLVLVATKSLPANTLPELIEYAKRTSNLSFGSGGAGSTAHLAGELLNLRTGLKLEHIAYKGGSQSMTDLIGGHVPLVITAVATSVGFIKDGQIKAIAVLSAKRSAALPDTPTFAEAGLTGFEVPTWAGLLAPAKTPPAIVEKLYRETKLALADPEVRKGYAALGLDPVGNTPAEFAEQIRRGLEGWEPVVKRINFKPN